MEIKIRRMISEDREAIKSILLRCNVFNQVEINCALELIDIYLNNPSQKDYLIASALTPTLPSPRGGEGKRERVVGYTCYGKTPLTDSVYDIYWLVVKTEYQRYGIGKRLLKYIEDEIIKLSGRMLLAETSSRAVYEKTRRFYLKNGFEKETRVKDFYSTGDDKIIYKKIFSLP